MIRGNQYAPQHAKLHQTRGYLILGSRNTDTGQAHREDSACFGYIYLYIALLPFWICWNEGRLAIMIYLLLLLSLFSLTRCNALSIKPLTIANVSRLVAPSTSNLTKTGLTTHNDCFDHSLGHLFTVTKADCEHALDNLVRGKSLLDVRTFSYRPSVVVTDRLPVLAHSGTCSLVLMMFDVDEIVSMTYAEIYAELLGPDGLLKECLGPRVPAVDALGGQTVIGPGNMLIADVTGQPDKAAN